MIEFSIMTIAAFVGALNEVVKFIAKSLGKNVNRYIPICSIVFGACLGICGYFIDTVDMGHNIVEALFIGLSAGGAATGCHQIYKQLLKYDDNTENTSTEEDDVNDNDNR